MRLHGHASRAARSLTFRSWQAMLGRCYYPSTAHFDQYGGRGITVCERWHTFASFLSDMGERVTGMTLDRIDTNGNYEPDNCRWVSRKENSRNRRNNRILELDGVRLAVTAWADKVGLSKDTLMRRLRAGWDVRKALTTPADQRFRNRVSRSTTPKGST